VTDHAANCRSHAATPRSSVRVLLAAGLVGLAAGVAHIVVEPTRLLSIAFVLLPSLDATSPMVAVEAMAAGTAPVASAHGDSPSW
jgi:hypothetical protein